jgi:predicted TIM-barrel fold metal-dependent hydrolase
VTIILDHIAGPLGIGPYACKQDEVFQIWKAGMTELATCPNVVIKLGGFGMPLGGFRWHKREAPPSSADIADVMGPYYLHCIEQFGVDHCMFESNFPVDKVSTSYTVLWNAFKRMTADFSDGERAALFRDTAVRSYRLSG